MKNIFKRLKENDDTIKVEVFENWDEVEMKKFEEKIKNQKTEELKEWMIAIKHGLVAGIGAALVGVLLGLIAEELTSRK